MPDDMATPHDAQVRPGSDDPGRSAGAGVAPADDWWEGEEPATGSVDAAAHLEGVVRQLAAALVDEPDAVRVSSRGHEHAIHLTLQVGEGELGKVIGRQGRTARAIRTAVQIAGARHDVRATLDIEG